MKVFTDAAGRTWTIALNLGTAMQVKDTLGIDLLRPEDGNPPLLTRLGTDEMLLGEVLCALLSSQFEKHKVTAADVRMAFDGATLLSAQTAFYEELADFFQARGRTDRARAVRAQMQMILRATAAIENKIGAMDLDAMIDGALSGTWPDASGSTPGT